MSECIVCNSTHHVQFYAGILQCQQCGHVFADLNLREDELFALYRKSFFFGEAYSDYLEDKPVIQKNFALRLKVLRRFLDPARHRRLFEIGSAYGFFLETIRDQFDSVQGIDITEDGVRHARDVLGLDVVQADFLTHQLDGQCFDVVCLWDTIEHLQRPDLYIEKASHHIPSGGLIALTTGDIDSLNARLKKEQWRLIHPPIHVHYFSRRTLARLLEKHGFEIVYDRYGGFYRSMKNVAYIVLVLRQNQRWLYDLLEKIGLYRFDFYLNLYDIMYVIARKR